VAGPSTLKGIASTARKGRAFSGTIISPLAQVLKENLPGKKPNARLFDFSSGNRMIIMFGF
jgi:hypothetical protein